MEGIIRRVRPGDSPAILGIYAYYIENTAITFETEVPGQDDFARRVAGIAAGYPYLVYEEDGEIAGYAYASQYRARSAYRFGAEVSVYLRHGRGGHGVGKRLYAALLAVLRAQGYYNAYGVVTVPNPASARLHEKFGFAKAGTHHKTGYKLGRWVDVDHWELALRPHGESPAEPLPVAALPEAFWEEVLAAEDPG